MSTMIYRDQFSYQRLYSRGKILNVGSNTDGAGLAAMGAVNLDLRLVDHVTHEAMPVHVLADGRALPFSGAFDSVVLGEILEHMEHAEAVLTLREALRALKPGGRVVITMPHDQRRDDGRLEAPAGDAQYYVRPQNGHGGIFAYHYRSIGWPELAGWIAEAGLTVQERSRIHYVWGEHGSGVVAIREQPC